MAAITVLALSAAGCDGGQENGAGPATPTATVAPTPLPTLATPAEQPSLSPAPELAVRRVELAIPPVADLSTAWRQQMFVPYGDGVERLGVADTHGGATPPWGPEYGAPAADGSWWFLDVHKRRIARYDSDGDFLSATPIPGEHVGLQFPFVLDSGWLYAAGAPDLALVADADTAYRVDVPPSEQLRVWSYSDWASVYSDDGRQIHTLTVGADGRVDWGRAEHFLTPDGRRFLARVDPTNRSMLQVSLPDAQPVPLRLDLDLTASEPTGARIEPGVEVAADGAGRIHLLFYGGVSDGQQLAGYTSIGPDGSVGPIEPVRNPFSASDPGSPAHVRTVSDRADVALMFVDVEGVRVFVRSR